MPVNNNHINPVAIDLVNQHFVTKHLIKWLIESHDLISHNPAVQNELKHGDLDSSFTVTISMETNQTNHIIQQLHQLIETWLALVEAQNDRHIFASKKLTRQIIHVAIMDLNSPTSMCKQWPPTEHYWEEFQIIHLGHWLEHNLSQFYLHDYHKADVYHYWLNRWKISFAWAPNV